MAPGSLSSSEHIVGYLDLLCSVVRGLAPAHVDFLLSVFDVATLGVRIEHQRLDILIVGARALHEKTFGSVSMAIQCLQTESRTSSRVRRIMPRPTGQELLASGHEIVGEDGELADQRCHIARIAGPLSANGGSVSGHGHHGERAQLAFTGEPQMVLQQEIGRASCRERVL